jgi:TfoX/Sxy family transcriptional regulator of competence genes
MATKKGTIDFLLKKLGSSERFTARAMFGEYALYADAKPVALVCDDRLFVKIIPASKDLAALCEQGPPYPGAKPHYVLDEEQWTSVRTLPKLLLDMAAELPAPKKKAARKK